MRRGLRWFPLLYTLGVTAFLVLGPVYSGASSTISPNGSTVAGTTKTLVEVNGAGVLFLLAVPILLTSVPLVVQRFRQRTKLILMATVLMAAFVFVTGFSIGYTYLPAVIALALATDAAGKATPAAAPIT